MRRVPVGLLSSLAIIAAALAPTASATDLAAQLRPENLRVFGGEDTWHADNDFRLDWDRPQVARQGFPVTAVDYRVRDATGVVVVPEVRLPWDTAQIEHIHVPHPGIYTADVWLEGPSGTRGPRESATLRFDDVQPGPGRPLAPAGWIGGGTAAVVKIEHPAAPLPISGIRGYAVSVDRGAGTPPCAAADRCSVSEIDLRSGDTISLGLLPEGMNIVQAVAVSGSGMRSATIGNAIVRVDATRPEVTLSGNPRGWADGPVRVTANAIDALSGMASDGPGEPLTAISIDGGVPRVEPGAAASVVVAGEGSHEVAFYARDAAGNSGEESPSLDTVRIDERPPLVSFSRSQDPSEPERIEATIVDLQSGPDPRRGSIAVRPAGSRLRFEPLPTTNRGDRLLARWDSDAFPPGTYEFRTTGYDLAGNATSGDRRGNGTRMVLTNPLKEATAIQAGFGGRQLTWRRCARGGGQRRCRRQTVESYASRPASRTVPYGHGVSFGGLLSSSARPLGGLPVQIVETFVAGADPAQRTTTVLTKPDGSFKSRLAPGPSRRVEALFAGNLVLTRASGRSVSLKALGDIRLRASAGSARVGGAPVVFSGRVGNQGAPIPTGGRPIKLQFRLPGEDWSEFRTVQTDASGRFHYPYAFSDDDSRGVRFQFRAYAPAQDGWPYEPTASCPVIVTGR